MPVKASIQLNEQINHQESPDKIDIEPSAPLPAPGFFKNVSDRVLKAKVKLVESPYDLDAWNILIKDAQVYNLTLLSIYFKIDCSFKGQTH